MPRSMVRNYLGLKMGPNKTTTLPFIFMFVLMSGCTPQVPSTGTPTQQVTPIVIATQTTTPTKSPTIQVTAVPSATELPIIEIDPRGSMNPTEGELIITEIHMTSETSGWAFASNGDNVLVLHTSDGGISWRNVTPPIEIWSAYLPQDWDAQLGEGFFLDEDRAWISTQIVDSYDAFAAKTMLSTDDGGATWRMRTLPMGLGAGYGHFVDFIDPLHGWFAVYGNPGAGAGYTGLYRTRDGGASWEIVLDTLGTPSGSSGSRGLAFGDITTGVMTFKQFGWYTSLRINWTQDGGTTWKSQDLPKPEDPSISDPSISDFECGTAFPHAFSKLEVALLVECRMLRDVGSPDNEYLFTNFLYWTEDGGINWQSYPAPSGNLHLLNQNVGWMLGEEIHMTEDGGKTWTKINEVTWQGQFNFIDANHGWALARNDDEIALVKTENGGRSWMIVEPWLVP
jgi:photosystem II stability/assembly factor-like uncharacterized protein